MINNILLVNPWIYDFAAFDFWNKPIGLLYLASMLRQNAFHVFFMDCLDPSHPNMQFEPRIIHPGKRKSGAGSYPKDIISKPDILKTIPRNYHRYGLTPKVLFKSLHALPAKPDLIMMTSMMTYWYPAVFDLVQLLHELFPAVPVVLGGNYVTLLPRHALGSGAEYCLPGPSEHSIPAFFNHVYNRKLDAQPDSNHLDSYPYPAFDLLNQPDQVPIMTSRGCPYRCSYCASHLVNDGFRRRDPIRVVDEIEHWHRLLGIRHFSFYDDALLVDSSEMAVPMLTEIIKRNMPIQFHCPNGLHAREMTREVSDLIFKAGFKTIRIGYETSNPKRQKITGGKVCNDEMVEAVTNLRLAGYRGKDIGIYLLCGLPGQSAEEVEEGIRFVHSRGARPIIAEYSPIPGTELWDEAVASSPFPIADEPLFQNNTLLPCRNDSLSYDQYQRLKMLTRTLAFNM